ncbi:hypothetical protein [Caulobacter sp. LARHSG274]
MNEENLVQRFKPLIEECQQLRGWLINSFAQVEFLLGDIVCRAWELPEFVSLRRPIPMGVGNRLAALRELLEFGTSMDSFKGQIEIALTEFERFEEVRHFLTHGFCSFDVTGAGDAAMRFRRYIPPKKGGSSELLELYMLPQELRDAAGQWTTFANDFVALSSQVYAQFKLEDVGPSAKRVIYRPHLKPGDRSK